MNAPNLDSRRATPGYAASQSKNKQIERVLDVLYRRRWIIATVFVLVMGVGIVYTLQQEPVYQATSLIMVELNRMPGGESFVSEGNTPFVRSDRSIATELFVLQNSYTINARVNERLREMNAEDPSVAFPPRGGVQFSPASRSINNAIAVSATSLNPQEAALLANLYAEEYVRQTQDASRTHLVQTHDFLEKQAAKRREELRTAEDAVESYMERTGAVGLNQEGSSLVARIAGLEAQRDEARIDMQMKQTQLSSINAQLNDINAQLPRRVASNVDRRLAALQENLTRLEEERRVILGYTGTQDQKRLGEINAEIPRLEAEVDQLTQEYVNEVMAVGGNQEGSSAVGFAVEMKRNAVQQGIEVEGLQSRIGTLTDRLREYQAQLANIPGQSTDLARLERTRQHAEQMYQYVVERLQETKISLESEPGYARVLRHASVPGVPFGADPFKNIAMALLLGLAAGIGLALVRDKLDNRIYKPDQLRDRDLDVIGVIPGMEALIKKEHGGNEFADYHGQRVSTNLTTLLQPLSSTSEAYRHLRTAVQFSRPGAVVQTVLVTSAAPSEGKSTTAANFALTMAQAKRRTLLIDADIRKPRQHKMFGCPLEPGLVQLLFHGEIALDVFQTPFDENLFVMPAGTLLSNPIGEDGAARVEEPSEILGSKRMRDVLETLRGQFDIIVIDSPPVLSATDAVLLSTQADATIVVASAGTTKEADLDLSLERLGDVGAHVIGTLLNRFDLSMAYGYKYSYGQYGPYSKYSYGQDEAPKPWWKRLGHKEDVS